MDVPTFPCQNQKHNPDASRLLALHPLSAQSLPNDLQQMSPCIFASLAESSCSATFHSYWSYCPNCIGFWNTFTLFKGFFKIFVLFFCKLQNSLSMLTPSSWFPGVLFGIHYFGTDRLNSLLFEKRYLASCFYKTGCLFPSHNLHFLQVWHLPVAQSEDVYYRAQDTNFIKLN